MNNRKYSSFSGTNRHVSADDIQVDLMIDRKILVISLFIAVLLVAVAVVILVITCDKAEKPELGIDSIPVYSRPVASNQLS